MTSTPELSIVIVSFRCRDLLLACLHSLHADPAHVGWEIVVVDNDSRDGTVAAVREGYPGVEVVALEENVGFARANNLALRRARGRHLLLLNPDTVVPVGALPACIAALDRAADVGVLGCKLVQPDGELDHACKRGFPTPLNALWYFLGLARAFPASPRFAAYTAGHVDPDRESPVDAVNGAFMLVRREALEEVGLLDDSFWMYGEDLDWCYRFWAGGWKVLYHPGAQVVHVKGGSTTQLRAWRSNRAFHEAMWLFYDKHYARLHGSAFNAAIRVAIYAKLLVSAARSWSRRRRLARRRPRPRATAQAA